MLPITSMTAALAAVALVVLSIRVSLHRKKSGVKIGLGEDVALMRRIRAQGNFIEYVPLALILLALAEYRQAPAAMLWTIAGLLIVGRGLHVAEGRPNGLTWPHVAPSYGKPIPLVKTPGAGDVPQHQDIVQFRPAGDA